jgi:Xaa-Pro aminopeptidase
MKKDLDTIMKKHRVNAIYAEGKSSKNANMYYLLNGANMHGIFVKQRGRKPFVVHSPIEREVAQQTGSRLINWSLFNTKKIAEKYHDTIKTNAELMKMILEYCKISGTIAYYGATNMGMGYNVLKRLSKVSPRTTIYYEKQTDIVMNARMTKDQNEVKRIKKAGKAVIASFNAVISMVRNAKVKKNTVMKDRKRSLRIGDLRSMLQVELLHRGYVNSEGMIVAQGRDAGVPHNAGNDRESVKLGKTIVFDIFPQEIGGGYFFDFTRTVCFGFAPKPVKEMYAIVKEAQDLVFEQCKEGKLNRQIEVALCRFFGKYGHPTFLTDARTQKGYCHSLGHGLGLNVHERPTFGLFKTNRSRISRGQVFTIEPGLYYPDRGFGIRLEDVAYVNSRGRVENLTKCARKLVIGM